MPSDVHPWPAEGNGLCQASARAANWRTPVRASRQSLRQPVADEPARHQSAARKQGEISNIGRIALANGIAQGPTEDLAPSIAALRRPGCPRVPGPATAVPSGSESRLPRATFLDTLEAAGLRVHSSSLVVACAVTTKPALRSVQQSWSKLVGGDVNCRPDAVDVSQQLSSVLPPDPMPPSWWPEAVPAHRVRDRG